MDEHEPFPEEDLEPTGGPAPLIEAPEVPEADAVEQSLDLVPDRDAPPRADALVPEADAIEQARVVEVDDEDRG